MSHNLCWFNLFHLLTGFTEAGFDRVCVQRVIEGLLHVRLVWALQACNIYKAESMTHLCLFFAEIFLAFFC